MEEGFKVRKSMMGEVGTQQMRSPSLSVGLSGTSEGTRAWALCFQSSLRSPWKFSSDSADLLESWLYHLPDQIGLSFNFFI